MLGDIVIVHGVGQQYLGPESLRAQWYPAISDGVVLAGRELAGLTVSAAYYGDLFRPSGRAVSFPEYDQDDLGDEFERELLHVLWCEAARVDGRIQGPDDRSRARTPRWVQRALYALSCSAFFGGYSERLLIGDLKQVARYFRDPAMRSSIRLRVSDSIADDTRLVIGHSLGSVIAYEALCEFGDRRPISFLSLGSPLGIPNLIFERLEPCPIAGRGQWPRVVRSWTNVADSGDIVALAKSLGPVFRGPLVDILVHNGVKAHDIRPYLTAKETGAAIAKMLDL